MLLLTTRRAEGIMPPVEGDRTFSFRLTLAAAAAYTAMAIAVTWPLIRGLAVRIPADLGDPLLNVWTLWWDLGRITSLDLKGYFDGSIMYPLPGSLAMSEHLTGIALLALPVRLFTRNPVIIYNAMYLFSFVFAGTAAFVLARRLTGSTAGALAAGFVFAFGPYRFAQDGHLQVLSSGFIPLAFLFLVEITDRARPRDAVLLGLCFALQAMSNMYFGVFLAIALPLAFAAYGTCNAGLARARVWVAAALAAAIAAAVLIPFTLPYIDIRERFGFIRNLEQITSLRPSHFIGTRHFNWLYGGVLTRFDLPEGALFPGLAAIPLAFAGLFYRRAERGTRLAFAALIVVGLMISMGPRPRFDVLGVTFEGGRLYRFLYDAFPGFSGTRVPFRFWVVPMLSIAVLASCGVAGILSAVDRRVAYPLVAAFVLFLPAEYFAPIPIQKFPQGLAPPAIYERLRDLPDGPVLEIPADAYGQMYYATVHGKRTYTPFSGIHSPIERAVTRIQGEPAWDLALPLLESMGIRYLVVRKNYPHAMEFSALEERGPVPLARVYEDALGTIYELRGRGPMFLDAARDLCDFAAEVHLKYDLKLMLRLNAAPDRPVVPVVSFVPGVLRLRLAGREVASVPVRFALPPYSTGEEWSTARAVAPYGKPFDEVCVEIDEVVFCTQPQKT